jgi:Probable zinc-ribbon domain
MAAGFFRGEPTGDPAGIPSDPDCWSESDKRSVAYTFAPEPYRDKAYLCWRCKLPDVFTAAEQKHYYEVRKVNLSQSHSLCRECFRVRVGLDREVLKCRRRWITERPALLRDPEFLRRWLVVLEELPMYCGATDRANIVMLERLVAASKVSS